ncbi:MAG: hypothetical protein AAFU84_18880 [Cyanobacteria bacterium J06633_23]
MKLTRTEHPLMTAMLSGAVIGFAAGFVIFAVSPLLITWSPSLSWLTYLSGRMARMLTELGVYIVCGQAPSIGCASGIGLLLFFLLQPLIFCLLTTLIGAAVGLMVATLRGSARPKTS